MQLDAVELEAEMSDINGDSFGVNTNHTDDHIQPDIGSTGMHNDSDQEYESWDGFGSGTYLQKNFWSSLTPSSSHNTDRQNE